MTHRNAIIALLRVWQKNQALPETVRAAEVFWRPSCTESPYR